jgi:hypothetical protein
MDPEYCTGIGRPGNRGRKGVRLLLRAKKWLEPLLYLEKDPFFTRRSTRAHHGTATGPHGHRVGRTATRAESYNHIFTMVLRVMRPDEHAGFLARTAPATLNLRGFSCGPWTVA